MFITPEVAYVCELLHKYDVLPLECDGHTMVVSCLLDRFCDLPPRLDTTLS